MQGLRLASYDGEYLYRGYGQQEQLAEEYASLPCICVYAGVGYYENLPEFMHYDRTLLVTAEELAERKDVDSLRMLDRVVVLIEDQGFRKRRFLRSYGRDTAWNRRRRCFPKGCTEIIFICM